MLIFGSKDTWCPWRTLFAWECMLPPWHWNLDHPSQWAAAVGTGRKTPSFISRCDKLVGMMYIPELIMGPGWGWDQIAFFLILILRPHFLTAFSSGHLLINHFYLNSWLCVCYWENLTSTDGQMSEPVTGRDRIYAIGMEGIHSSHSRAGDKESESMWHPEVEDS